MLDFLSRYGEVLDLGIYLSHGCYTGQGYATLNISPKPVSIDEDAELVHFEPLERVLLWTEDDGDEREIYLEWQDMPNFYRICQASDHCCADCPQQPPKSTTGGLPQLD